MSTDEGIVIDGRKYPEYAKVYTEEFLSPEVRSLTAGQRDMWILLACRCNKRLTVQTRQWHMAYKEFEEVLGMHHSSVARNLKVLESKGLMKRLRKGLGRWNQYILLTPPSVLVKRNETSAKRECDSGCLENATIDVAPGGAIKQGTKLEVVNSMASHPEKEPYDSERLAKMLLYQSKKNPHKSQEPAARLLRSLIEHMVDIIGHQDVEIWLERLHALRTVIKPGNGHTLVLLAPNHYYAEWIEQNYTDAMNKWLRAGGYETNHPNWHMGIKQVQILPTPPPDEPQSGSQSMFEPVMKAESV